MNRNGSPLIISSALFRVFSLRGLEGLTTLGKNEQGYSIHVSDNAKLTSLAALGSLQGKLPGAILVMGNPALTSLHGLEGLTSVLGKDSNGYSILPLDRHSFSVSLLRSVFPFLA